MDEPLTIQTVSEGSPMAEYELAPGVFGYAMEHRGAIYIPVIRAENKGVGDVGRFLDQLPVNARIPSVISSLLLAMLRRRGWQARTEIDEQFGELVVVFIHPEAKVEAVCDQCGCPLFNLSERGSPGFGGAPRCLECGPS